ncbi:Transport and Golgi organization protein 2 [Vanrija pseudolonga]|uniref:Transport and Golgi organization protein 2 n=1 Tax=Vanrija pseudolonga TaxID=143232 RepID=A0AAF0YF88_9TREE|nr:Transport and Golgi organization protein 2 [Vanrija pseudolonga]
MCIVFYTQVQPGYKLVLAANRDEYLDRPASAAHWHRFEQPEQPRDDDYVLCGRDLGSPDQGTWLGITRDLRIGILTNIRYPVTPTTTITPSRGLLLKAFLAPPPAQAPPIDDFLNSISSETYAGFNLLLFHLHKRQNGWGEDEIGYLCNQPQHTLLSLSNDNVPSRGISNSPLDAPFPKVVEGEARMTQLLADCHAQGGSEDDLVENLMSLLSPSRPIKTYTDMTHSTRIDPFLLGPNPNASPTPEVAGGRWYATRVSTVILVKDDGQVLFVERDIATLEDGVVIQGSGERKERFAAEFS